jgi:recombination protein RecA
MNARMKTGADALLKQMEKRFGKGAVMTMDRNTVTAVPTFSTGSIGLDSALGCGGLPYGRVVEIYGPESSGKTTLTLHAIAEVQAAGKRAAFIDAEHALDPAYAGKLGVQMDSLLVSQPDCGEQALEIAEALISSGEVSLVVVDSVAALTPRAEIEGAMGDSHMGLQARLMSQALRKLTSLAYKNRATIIFINQLRQKIGVVFGNPETTTGGNALKFYASVRLDVRRIGALKLSDSSIVGNRTRVKVAKNKMAPPFRQAEFDIRYGEGICRPGEILDRSIESGLVEKTGSWLSLDGERLAQGREKTRQRLREEPELLAVLCARIQQPGAEAEAEAEATLPGPQE